MINRYYESYVTKFDFFYFSPAKIILANYIYKTDATTTSPDYH